MKHVPPRNRAILGLVLAVAGLTLSAQRPTTPSTPSQPSRPSGSVPFTRSPSEPLSRRSFDAPSMGRPQVERRAQPTRRVGRTDSAVARVPKGQSGTRNLMAFPDLPYRHLRLMAPVGLWNRHNWCFMNLPHWQKFMGGLRYPTREVPGDANEVVDYVDFFNMGRAYAFRVPKGGQLRVDLDHPNAGWFATWMTGKWGTPLPGMLQNFTRGGNLTKATYHNVSDSGNVVYLLVSDPEAMSNATRPYRLTIQRSWSPDEEEMVKGPVSIGIFTDESGSVSAEKAR